MTALLKRNILTSICEEGLGPPCALPPGDEFDDHVDDGVAAVTRHRRVGQETEEEEEKGLELVGVIWRKKSREDVIETIMFV